MSVNANELKAFCVALPKIELHAHINGSISHETISKLRERKVCFMARYTLDMDLIVSSHFKITDVSP
jgi:adenosine deaminase